MSFVVGPSKMGHAIQTRKGRSATLAAVGVEFFPSENIATALRQHGHISLASRRCNRAQRRGMVGARLGRSGISTSHEKDTITVIRDESDGVTRKVWIGGGA